VSSPYATLLSVRRIEEKQAEVEFAVAQRETLDRQRELDKTRGARDAWLLRCLEVAEDAGQDLAGLMTRLEQSERDAELAVDAATRRLDQRRQALVEAKRRRQAVEDLHAAVLESQARTRARRAQAELDDIAGIAAAARREDSPE
jgi:flagellar export protein FliJ